MTKIIAFDLDGTLVNSAPDITFALNKVLVNNKLKPVSNREVKNLIGNGAKALIIPLTRSSRNQINRQGAKFHNFEIPLTSSPPHPTLNTHP